MQVQRLTSHLLRVQQDPPPVSRATAASLIAHPDKFSGDPAQCLGFLLQSLLYFAAHKDMSVCNKIVLLISLFTGKALTWAVVVWERGCASISSYEYFVTLFRQVFDHAPKTMEVNEWLLSARKGACRAEDYALEFHMLAAESGWNEVALKTVFHQGLNTEVRMNMRSGEGKDYAFNSPISK